MYKEKECYKNIEEVISPEGFEIAHNYPSTSFGLNLAEGELNVWGMGRKIEEMFLILNELYEKAKEEILGYFNLEDALTLAASFLNDGYELKPHNYRYSKELLIEGIRDYLYYGILRHKNELETAEELISKINKLTNFQCYVVIMMICECRVRRRKIEYIFDLNILLRKVFAIKETEEES